MNARAKDWGKRVGRRVVVTRLGRSDFQPEGTLCGYETDGDGNIVQFRVAFAPADWGDFKVEDVEMVG